MSAADVPVWLRHSAERLHDASAALPARPADLAEVQHEVNFVVFAPLWVPADCRILATTIRPEQPPGRPGISADAISQTPHSDDNPCSLRIEIGSGERRLRIKEFLYDWAPPTAGTATLWKTPWLVPFESGDAAGWIGIDFKGNLGACVQLARTQIELSVIAGTFDGGELKRVLGSLAESDPGRAAAVKQTPFHRLSYHVRYRTPSTVVPHGLFRHQRPRRYDAATIVPLEATVFAHVAERVSCEVPWSYVHDSSVRIVDSETAHLEDESIFRDALNFSDHLWLSCVGDTAADAYDEEPAVYREHPCAVTEVIRAGGIRVSLASVDRRYGGHEAMWSDEGRRFALWTSPSLRLDYASFRDRVLPAVMHA